MSFQDDSSVLLTVTKSAVMKTDMTPSISNRGAIRSSAPSALVAETVLPTGEPTQNFIARGFGVVSTVIPIATLLSLEPNRSGDQP